MTRCTSPYDNHVWFDSEHSNISWEILLSRKYLTTTESLISYIHSFTPWYKHSSVFKEQPVTNKLVLTLQEIISSQGLKIQLKDFKSVAKFLHSNEKFFNEISLPNKIPPKEIHRMQRNPYWCGDFYSSDLVVNILNSAKCSFITNDKYLDLGCSSGSLLRVLKWYFPYARWFGCDPVFSSIKWANQNLTGIQFDFSNQKPPLCYDNDSFNGVSAISIWSHHGAESAKLWFKEIHRIIKPGGWFLFTTHGLRSLYYYTQKYNKGIERWLSIYEGLIQNNHVFEEVWLSEDDVGNSATDWGNFYVKPDWIYKQLLDKFEMKVYLQGGNQSNQDVYLLTKK
jgi:SAM-dependent methyltransferase